MAFLADILMLFILGSYLWLNRRLYVWRLAVTEKYPHRNQNSDPSFKSFKADLRGTWELIVSVLLLSILLTGLLFFSYWPLRYSHAYTQLAILIPVIYWTFTFVSMATYPDSHRFVRWMGRKARNSHIE